MRVEDFIKEINVDYFTGVPDSILKPISAYLQDKYAFDYTRHVIAANEGNAVSMAAGYYLSTKKVPAVYLQNSGQGNIINSVCCLLNENAYAIPAIFIVGYRGEPGIKDDACYSFHGQITKDIFEALNIPFYVLNKDTTVSELKSVMEEFKRLLNKGKQVAFLVRKNALFYENLKSFIFEDKNESELIKSNIDLYESDYEQNIPYQQNILYEDKRIDKYEAIRRIIKYTKEDCIVSTDGKISAILFELRKKYGNNMCNDFLALGAMGQASSIAFALASSNKDKTIWCLDGDGALIMDMGALAVIGTSDLNNLTHVVFNNGAHESEGGMPTAAGKINLCDIAKACGYGLCVRCCSYEDLESALNKAEEFRGKIFIEIVCSCDLKNEIPYPEMNLIKNKNKFINNLLKV